MMFKSGFGRGGGVMVRAMRGKLAPVIGIRRKKRSVVSLEPASTNFGAKR
jgi:hypothetical protein